MAQPRLKDDSLSFYPPRSRWYNRVVYGFGRGFRRSFNLDALHSPAPLSPGGLLLAILLPGFSFFALGRRALGWTCVVLYFAAAALFLVRLGFLSGSLAYGLLISVHATSIVYLENRWMHSSSFFARVGLGLCTLFAIWALMYAPLSGLAIHSWFTAVRSGNTVWVVKPGVNPRELRRGDWVLYRIQERSGPGVYLPGGLGLDRVLGLPGDEVRFTKDALVVNGTPHARRDLMPTTGELAVPENVWFIWPDFAIRGGRGAPVAGVMGAMREAALVTPEQMLGRPYKRWFGRQQWP